MKTYMTTGSAALALVAALATSNASALSTGNLAADVVSAVGGDGHVSISIDGRTATLSGYVENAMVARAARRAALEHDEIDEVIDLLSRS